MFTPRRKVEGLYLFTPRVGLKVFLIVYSEGRVEGQDHCVLTGEGLKVYMIVYSEGTIEGLYDLVLRG